MLNPLKDTEQFVNVDKDIRLEEVEKIVIFDIGDMYPSLPKYAFKTKYNKEALIKLAKISIKFVFQNR